MKSTFWLAMSLLIVIILNLAALYWWVFGPDDAVYSIDAQGLVSSVAFSPDSQLLAVAVPTHDQLRIYRSDDGSLVSEMSTGSINRVQFSPDGTLLAAGGSDGLVRLWLIAESKVVGEFAGHSSAITALAFRPDGQALATGSQSGDLYLWAVPSGERLATRQLEAKYGIEEVALRSSTDAWYASVTAPDASVHELWSFAVDNPDYALKQDAWLYHGSQKEQLGLSESRLLRLDNDHYMPYYQSGALFEYIKSVVISDDDALFAIAQGPIPNENRFARNVPIHLWRTDTDQRVQSFRGHEQGVYSLDFSPNGRFLASGGGDATVKLWLVGSGTADRMLLFLRILGAQFVLLML